MSVALIKFQMSFLPANMCTISDNIKQIIYDMLCIKTVPPIVSIRKPQTTSLGDRKSCLLQYPFQCKGNTLKVDI